MSQTPEEPHRPLSKMPTLLEPGSLRLADGTLPSAAVALETPIEYITTWIRDHMPEFGHHSAALADRILIVRAETGSGKSTVLPVALFRILRNKNTPARLRYRGPSVICTQPRVFTALALAADVSVSHSPWNTDMVLGETVGFQTGPISNRPRSGLVFATAGVLAVQLRQQDDAEIMARYRFIIVDEAHERSLDSDMLLAMLRGFYLRNVGNEQLPFLLLASATILPARYAEYFGVESKNVIEVIGRPHPIKIEWPAQGTNNYPVAAADATIKIHEGNPDDKPEQADILIFMPGAAESMITFQRLFKANKKYFAPDETAVTTGGAATAATAATAMTELGPMLLLVVNGEIVKTQSGDYDLIFEKPGRLPMIGGRRPARRVIIATVVAETGLTIDTLRYVIDAGWNRAREVYQPWAIEGLTTRPAAHSRIMQRKGRVGRLFPGEFHPLYTKNVYEALDAVQLPEIILAGPADVFLAIVREQQRQKLRLGQVPEFRVEDIATLDPPPPEALLSTLAAATAAGFVSARSPLLDRWPFDPVDEHARGALSAATHGYGLTPLGYVGAAFSRVSMAGARILLAGYTWGVAASDLATIVAMFGATLASLLLTPDERDKRGLPAGAEALRASLPSFLVSRVGGGITGALPPTEGEMFYFRARLLIADDFIEALLLFDAFARRLDTTSGDVVAVAAWCEEIGLNFDAMLMFARRREEVIEEMIVAGLNPFRLPEKRLMKLTAETFTDGLRRIKRCLYDGLRIRLLTYSDHHPEGPGYVTVQGIRVKTPSLFSDAMMSRLRAIHVTPGASRDYKPKWILTDLVRLKGAAAQHSGETPPLLYVPEANLVSVLDGFVDPDLNFITARSFAVRQTTQKQ